MWNISSFSKEEEEEEEEEEKEEGEKEEEKKEEEAAAAVLTNLTLPRWSGLSSVEVDGRVEYISSILFLGLVWFGIKMNEGEG